MTGPALAVNAHSYVFQTLADLGIVGLAAQPRGRGRLVLRGGPRDRALPRPRAPAAARAERIGLLTMVAVVVIFAVHSASTGPGSCPATR